MGKQISGLIRRSIEGASDLDDAIAAAQRASREDAALESNTMALLLTSCVRAGQCADAITFAQFADTTGVGLSLQAYCKMLQSFLSRTQVTEGLMVMHAMEPLVTDFASPATGGYFFHFSRLVIDEYLNPAPMYPH